MSIFHVQSDSEGLVSTCYLLFFPDFPLFSSDLRWRFLSVFIPGFVASNEHFFLVSKLWFGNETWEVKIDFYEWFQDFWDFREKEWKFWAVMAEVRVLFPIFGFRAREFGDFFFCGFWISNGVFWVMFKIFKDKICISRCMEWIFFLIYSSWATV